MCKNCHFLNIVIEIYLSDITYHFLIYHLLLLGFLVMPFCGNETKYCQYMRCLTLSTYCSRNICTDHVFLQHISCLLIVSTIPNGKSLMRQVSMIVKNSYFVFIVNLIWRRLDMLTHAIALLFLPAYLFMVMFTLLY